MKISISLFICLLGMQLSVFAKSSVDRNSTFATADYAAIDIYDQTTLPAPPVPPRKDLGETQYKAPSPQPQQPKLPAPPVPPRKDLGETQFKAPSPQPGAKAKPSNPYGQIPPEKPTNNSNYSKLPPPENYKAPKSQYGAVPPKEKTPGQYGKAPSQKSTGPYGQVPAEKPANNSNYSKLPPPDNYQAPKNQYGAIPPKEKTPGQYGQVPGQKSTGPYGQVPAEKPANNSNYSKLPPPENYKAPKNQYGAVPPKEKTPGQYGKAPGLKLTNPYGQAPPEKSTTTTGPKKTNPKKLNKTQNVKSGLVKKPTPKKSTSKRRQ